VRKQIYLEPLIFSCEGVHYHRYLQNSMNAALIEKDARPGAVTLFQFPASPGENS
jgi:hypothetical protein